MSEADALRLTLSPSQLYGWTMYPGYFDRPYRSPVLIEQIDQRQENVFELSFLNMCYAAGVQRMEYLLRSLRWESTYMVAEQLQGRSTTDRVVVIERLDIRWVQENVPTISNNLCTLFDEDGRPLKEEFLRLVRSVC